MFLGFSSMPTPLSNDFCIKLAIYFSTQALIITPSILIFAPKSKNKYLDNLQKNLLLFIAFAKVILY